MSASFPSFAEFFRAGNRGRAPFPWQSRLAKVVAAEGWPVEIGVPTGLGKTACIDIALWALSAQADRREQRTASTRIWYVVERRLLVDAAYDHGAYLSHILRAPATVRTGSTKAGATYTPWRDATDDDIDVLASVARALRSIAAYPDAAQGPLHITRLRGGAALGQRSPDPSRPTIIFATATMYGSRFLFRGYGSSMLMNSVDAALAGTDSLVLLDEAHLALPLRRMCAAAEQCDPGSPDTLLPADRARPQLVALTATGDEVTARFDIDEDDRRHSIIERRLTAAKPTVLVATSKRELVKELAVQAAELMRERPRQAGIVFCNTVATARGVHTALRAALRQEEPAVTVELLTGQMRPREADGARGRILEPINGAPAGRDQDVERSAGLLVVATQTLEVGADLDFDFLVTESAGVRAVVQRFGRLNRFGEAHDARGVICHPEDAMVQPPYGEEPAGLWSRLITAHELNLTPDRVAILLGQPMDKPDRWGELLPDHLWQYAKTSTRERDEPPPEVFFTGFDEERSVSISWRAHLPEQGGILVPPLHQEESVEVSLLAVRTFLDDNRRGTVRRLGPDGASLETVAHAEIRPGDRVVLPAGDGGYDEWGWNPSARETVLDVAALFRGPLWLVDPCHLLGPPLRPDNSEEADLKAAAKRLNDLLTADDEASAELLREERPSLVPRIVSGIRAWSCPPWLHPDEWCDFQARFKSTGVKVAMQDDGAYALGIPILRLTPESADIRSDAFDGLSFDVVSVRLDKHLVAVGEIAGDIAGALGLPDDVVKSVRMAARLHDVGKQDPRFQRLLRHEDDTVDGLLAKSSGPRTYTSEEPSGWPRGGRHEALSAMFVAACFPENDPGWDRDLVLHLVASHHGHGRPLLPSPGDPEPPDVDADADGRHATVRADLSLVDWAQPRRFRHLCERYGFWGLALLEAVVRQSDHRASKEAKGTVSRQDGGHPVPVPPIEVN